MSKRLLASLIVIALSVAVIGAGTFAYYSDTETSGANTFTAGTLNLTVFGVEKVDAPIEKNINSEFTNKVNNMKPGDHELLVIPVANTGSVPGNLSLTFGPLVETAGTGFELADGAKDLGAKMKVKILCGDVVKYDGTLAGLHNAVIAGSAIGAPADSSWTLDLEIPGTVGNEIMGDSAIVDMTFGLDQAL